MNKVLVSAGKATIYATNDGSGRDTYISFNNGGNTLQYQPSAKQVMTGKLHGGSMVYSSSMHIQAKTPHYSQNGTGRDTYILDRHGGFKTECPKVAASLAHVQSLRSYQ